jgi:tetratricopeptide (TPR) repeat protein
MASRLTVTGTHLGTPAYMSPESIRGETGPASDVFALGLVLWEMLAGRRAFPGDNAMAVMFAIANESPPPVRQLRPEISETAETLIARMLERNPAARIDAAEVARTLAEWTGVSASAVVPSTDVVPRVDPAAGAASRPPAPPQRKPSKVPARLVFGGLAVVVIAGLSGVAWLSQTARRRDEAVRLFEQSLAASQSGRGDEARRLLERALDRDPENADALSHLGLAALNEGRYARAESLFQAMLRHHRNDPSVVYAAHYNLGSSFDRRSMYPEALESYRAGFATDSSRADAYNNLGWALIQNRQPGDAITVLDRGIRKFPGEPYLRKNAGLAWLQLGEPRRALEQLERAVDLDSTLTEAVELRDRARREAARP